MVNLFVEFSLPKLLVCIGLQYDRVGDFELGVLYVVLVGVLSVRTDEFSALRCNAVMCYHLEISLSQFG